MTDVWDADKAKQQASASGLHREADMEMRYIYPHWYTPRQLTPFYLRKKMLRAAEVKEIVTYALNQDPSRDVVEDGISAWSVDLMPADFPHLYEKFGEAFNEANEEWNFNLGGWVEPITCIRYEKNDFNNWHADYTDTDRTKIGFTTLLTNPGADFDGGELEMLRHGDAPLKKAGDAVLFPGYQVHRVRKVTRGTRMSLAGWIGGPEFK